ncbi:MAG: AraC family transcriptional regulator [Prevotella sp.]|nr:AraC family transcriptional regulator [Prevotella sp.]
MNKCICLTTTALLITIWLSLPSFGAAQKPAGKGATCPMEKLEAVRLADLNVPRDCHSAFVAGGEVVVVGGHTSGFVPTATAEYLHGGKWHLLNTVYSHDQATSLPMRSGKVMIAGGHEQHLGIGQIFAMEFYDPASHTFTGWGCLDQKRCWASAIELDKGEVIITGNWYHDDSIEMYDGKVNNHHIKAVSVSRAYPYLFRTARDNVMMLSATDNRGNQPDTIVVDQLRGDPFVPALLTEWKPTSGQDEHRTQESFIGNEEAGDYRYLMALHNRRGETRIALTEGTNISLLPTKHPIPSKTEWGEIDYFTALVVDRQAMIAYLTGADKHQRLYVLAVDYAPLMKAKTKHEPLSILLYYTEPLAHIGFCQPLLTPKGNLMMAGGIKESNFSPYASVVLLPVGDKREFSGDADALWWIAAALLLAAGCAAIYIIRCRRKPAAPDSDAVNAQQEKAATSQTAVSGELMERISQLMKEQKPYLNSEFKLSDIASMLGTNSRYVSDCIKQHAGCSFTQYINGFRIAHAQQLLTVEPDMKLAAVCIESGFSNETSFFRTFKTVTGMTPGEWQKRGKPTPDPSQREGSH